MDNRIIPWFPLPDLPETPCAIEMEGRPEKVTIRAAYSKYEGERDLLLELEAEVFGCFSEIAAPRISITEDYPRLSHPKYPRNLWPLMEVTNSTWLGVHRDRLWMPDAQYRHFRIVSDEGTFDALTCHEPFARWEAGRI